MADVAPDENVGAGSSASSGESNQHSAAPEEGASEANTPPAHAHTHSHSHSHSHGHAPHGHAHVHGHVHSPPNHAHAQRHIRLNFNNPPNAQGNQPAGNQQQPNVRQRLFYALFVRIALIYARFIPRPLQRALEFIMLIKAVACLAVLVYVHIVFIRTPATCLIEFKDDWPRDGVLRVEIIHNLEILEQQEEDARAAAKIEGGEIDFDLPANKFTSEETTPEDLGGVGDSGNFQSGDDDTGDFVDSSGSGPAAKQPDLDLDHDHASVLAYAADPRHDHDGGSLAHNVVYTKSNATHVAEKTGYSIGNGWISWLLTFLEFVLDENLDDTQQSSDGVAIIEYAREFGFLRLSPQTRARLGVRVLNIQLDSNYDACFGSNLSRFLLDSMLGYDDILMSSIKTLAEAENNSNMGYVRNVLTGEHYKFVPMSMTRVSYVTAFFIMLAFTFSISMLLRFAHQQLFNFIFDLLQSLELHSPITFPTTPFLTVILALVGMEAIMSEFFNDAATAFYIIMIVWIADQYDAVCCHTSAGRRYWLRFFYLYHFAFYAYHYRFNGQYGGLALATSWLFIQHSMLYFFHHYELPAVLYHQGMRDFINNLNGPQNADAGPATPTPGAPAEPNRPIRVFARVNGVDVASRTENPGQAPVADFTAPPSRQALISAAHRNAPPQGQWLRQRIAASNMRREAGERIAQGVVQRVMSGLNRLGLDNLRAQGNTTIRVEITTRPQTAEEQAERSADQPTDESPPAAEQPAEHSAEAAPTSGSLEEEEIRRMYANAPPSTGQLEESPLE